MHIASSIESVCPGRMTDGAGTIPLFAARLLFSAVDLLQKFGSLSVGAVT